MKYVNSSFPFRKFLRFNDNLDSCDIVTLFLLSRLKVENVIELTSSYETLALMIIGLSLSGRKA
jgi:hypothetical protein